MKKLKTAIVFDKYLYIGGTEYFLERLLEIFPNADLYTPLIKNKYKRKLESKGHTVHTTFLSKIPNIQKYSSFLKPFLFYYWEQLNLINYDLIISSSESYSSKAVLTSPTSLHLSYIHSAPKYLYYEYNRTRWINKKPLKTILSPLMHSLRKTDYIAAQRPDILLTNSKNVQKRIKKYYRRKSTIIPCPVKLGKISIKVNKKYYLCISRLSKEKHLHLAINACNKLKKPLLIVGTGSEEKNLRKIAGDTISFKTNQNNFLSAKEKTQIFSKAIALISCMKDEDFGIAPIEAMSYGVPVIGYKNGGLLDTIKHKKTGYLFKKHNTNDLIKGIIQSEKINWNPTYIAKHAQQFGTIQFQKSLMSIINKNISGKL